MKISEIISEYRDLRRNPMPMQTYVRVIAGMESRIKREIVDHFEDAEAYPYTGYKAETDQNVECIAPAPYDQIYVWALCYKHDLRENQTANAANSRSMQEDIFEKLAAYWIRNHKPKRADFRDPYRQV